MRWHKILMAASHAAIFLCAICLTIPPITAQPIVNDDALPRPRQTMSIDVNRDGQPDVVQAFSLTDTYDLILWELNTANASQTMRGALLTPTNLSDFPRVC